MKTFLFVIASMCSSIIYMNAQPGSLDRSFGTNGIYLDTNLYGADCRAMTIQADGKILTGGYTDTLSDNSRDGGFYIARFNKDGSVDETFGNKGKMIVRHIGNILAAWPKTIIVQPDNKILALGRFVPGALYGDVGLIRLNSDGSFDNSFGTNGFVLTSVSDWEDVLSGMVIQPDGKIVVAGNKQQAEDESGPDFVLRYLPDGTPDESFGEKGQVFTYFTSNIKAGAVVLQPDGKIVTGDRYGASTLQFQLIRYNTNGTLDESFGTGGISKLKPQSGYFSELNSLAIQDDGKILAAGRYSEASMALARFNTNGSPDSTFGNLSGYTYLYTADVTAIARSVFVTSSKNIILTGNYFKSSAEQIAVVQYNNNGTIDSSFGENGVAAAGFAKNKYGSDITSGVGLLQPDSKIIVSGSFLQNDDFTYNVALFRFNGDLSRKQIIITKIRRWLQHNGFMWDNNNNISSYVVQRSYDGSHFSSLARINAGNRLNYSYADPSPLSGTNYYRLQTTGTNGAVNYSNIIAVTNRDIKISPNPAKNVLQIQGLSSNKTKITVVDFAGNEKLQAVVTNTFYDLNIASLKAGNYLLNIEMNDEVVTKKFVKE